MSYYDLLSIASTATTDDIKKAYRKKALELHPDRCCTVSSLISRPASQLHLLAHLHLLRVGIPKVQRTAIRHSKLSAKLTRYTIGLEQALLMDRKPCGTLFQSFCITFAGAQRPRQESHL